LFCDKLARFTADVQRELYVLTGNQLGLEVPLLDVDPCLPRPEGMANYRASQANHGAVDHVDEIGVYETSHFLSGKVLTIYCVWDLWSKES
jgi:hypothetical protein